MTNTIKIKRGVGKPDSLLEGELAIDTSTGRLYSLVGGVVTELNEPPEDVDLSDYVTYDVDQDFPDYGKYSHSTHLDTRTSDKPQQGIAALQVTHSETKAVAGMYTLNGANGESTQMYLSNESEYDIPFDLSIDKKDRKTTYIHGSTYRWVLEAPTIYLGESGFPAIEVIANGTVQAADFLDADGNSIIGSGGGDSGRTTPTSIVLVRRDSAGTDQKEFWCLSCRSH